MDYVEKTIATYNQNPDKYVDSTREMTPLHEFQRFVKSVRRGGAVVLDAGCAFGRDTSAMQKAGLLPIGIDLSDGLLRKAHEMYPDMDFRKMDVRRLDFPDNHFDGIWCHAVLLHLSDEDIAHTLNEFHRVIKSGGILFVSFKKGNGVDEVLETFSSDAPRFYNFKTIEPLTTSLQEAGFGNIDAYYINEQDLFGPDKRDLEWLHCFAVKI